MTVEKYNKTEILNNQLKQTTENMMEYSENSNNGFQEIREQVNY